MRRISSFFAFPNDPFLILFFLFRRLEHQTTSSKDKTTTTGRKDPIELK